MSISEPSALPLELIEKIIDEAFYSQLSTGTRFKRIMVDPQALSSLACVSHIFRQRVNTHRFSIISFYKRESSLPYIHAFLDLLRSHVWVAPNMGVACHVRKLVLILGERDERGEIVPHRAIDDGSFTTIMNAVFRGDDRYPYSTSDYTLALRGFTESQGIHGSDWLSWEALNPDFISNTESLLDSCIATLDLTWLSVVPPTCKPGAPALLRGPLVFLILSHHYHVTTQTAYVPVVVLVSLRYRYPPMYPVLFMTIHTVV